MQQMTTSPSDSRRLHITPFTPELLPAVLNTSIRPLASEISFHCIPTFPDNNYGYVTLPTMEADKVKKKLHGSILKGKKFKVENAQPSKRQKDEDHAEPETLRHKPKSHKDSKKRKAKDNVVDGYLLEDRQVKRGWTEPTSAMQERRKEEKKKNRKGDKDAKAQAKSKYSENSECLFRTKVPPNRSSADEKKDRASKKKKSSKEPVVHEFANTITQPSFIRSGDNNTAPVSTFKEGVGWVDDSGNVKEQASDRIRKGEYRPGQLPGVKEKGKRAKCSSGDRKSQQSEVENAGSQKETVSQEPEDWTSSSGSSSSDGSSSDSESDNESAVSNSSGKFSQEVTPLKNSEREKVHVGNPEHSKSDSPSTMDQKKSAGEGTDRPTTSQEVHPLEALFKRPAPGSTENKPDMETDAQFSFFGQGDVESEEEAEEAALPQTPFTPFTKMDLQGRGMRSAAPTPDTALASRNIKWGNSEKEDKMDVDDELYASTPIRKSATGDDESEFTKWFWENRGDNNRAWKKRRRDAAKEQRQQDNRRKGMKGKS